MEAEFFSTVVWVKGRGYVPRSKLEKYKAFLIAHAQGVAPVEQPAPYPDPLVPLKQVGEELGIGRRTVGRRISEARKAASEHSMEVA
jgi:hypothetical protein